MQTAVVFAVLFGLTLALDEDMARLLSMYTPRSERVASRQTCPPPVSCVDEGAVCTQSLSCKDSYCNITYNGPEGTYSGLCLKYRGESKPCWGDNHCKPHEGRHCENGICLYERSIGEGCTKSDVCLTGACDPVEEKCVSPYTQLAGQPCGPGIIYNQYRYCQSGLYCKYGTSTQGTCTLYLAAGSACTSGSECASSCIDDKCVDPFTMNNGMKCQYNYDCLNGICSSEGVCVSPTTPWDGTGPSCSYTSPCSPDAECMCNPTTGQQVCYGAWPERSKYLKKYWDCYITHPDPWDCRGLYNEFQHQVNLHDRNPCSSASALSALFALAAVVVAFF